MGTPLDEESFTGPHPTMSDFHEKLLAWDFKPHKRKEDGRHLVMRCRGGGTVRVLRSLAGRADATQVAKAARLAGVTLEEFWAGPTEPADDEPPTQVTKPSPTRRRSATHDSVTALVLSVHSQASRPLGFDEVVRLVKHCGVRVTRDQVRSASAALCRDGNLDRVRQGVYQWARSAEIPSNDTDLLRLVALHPATTPTDKVDAPSEVPSEVLELFGRMFPDGVHVTAETLADFQRLTELTQKFSSEARAS